MLDAALAAASQILTPPFRRVLWKTLALTFALLSCGLYFTNLSWRARHLPILGQRLHCHG